MPGKVFWKRAELPLWNPGDFPNGRTCWPPTLVSRPAIAQGVWARGRRVHQANGPDLQDTDPISEFNRLLNKSYFQKEKEGVLLLEPP